MGGMRKTGTFPRKATAVLRKDSQNAGSANALGPLLEEETEQEINPFIKMFISCEKILSAEQDLMKLIIPESSHRSVFDALVQHPLDLLEKTGNKFVAYAKQCIVTHDHTSIVSLFPIIKHLKEAIPKYQDLLMGTTERNQLRLSRLLSSLEITANDVLQDFLDCVKSDPINKSNMPKDGTVHELTSNSMLFLQQLAVHSDVTGGVLGCKELDSYRTSRKQRECLARYLSHILGSLKLNLENKSRNYDDSALASIFLLNNYHFIITALKRNGQLQIVQLTTPNIEEIYKKCIDDQKNSFKACWVKLVASLGNVDGSIPAGAKLKDRERVEVKEKFKAFNNDFEALILTQQKWAMPDDQTKFQIHAEIIELVVKPFENFRNHYRMVQFTKNIEKYLKYTNESIIENIEKLFDQSSI